MPNNQITDMTVVYPAGTQDYHLEVSAGACKIMVAPGTGPNWVVGSYEYLEGGIPPKIEEEGGYIKITQILKVMGLSKLINAVPKLNLSLGTGKPYALTLTGGAAQAHYELGGLPLTALKINQGAGDFRYTFSAPNPHPMEVMSVDAGAGSMDFQNLANANFSELKLNGGAASYKLDFGGTLRRNGTVKISAGAASVEIRVPPNVPAQIIPDTTLVDFNAGNGLVKTDGAYWTEAALRSQSPLLTIHANVSLGSLHLKTH
jgi:hypothetical protein